jgi:chromosome partitioning protein
MATHFRQSDGSIACKRLNIEKSPSTDDIALVTCKTCISVANNTKTVHFCKSDGSIACGRLRIKDPSLTEDPSLITCQRCLSFVSGDGSGGRRRLGLDTKMVRVGFYEGDLDWAEAQASTLSELMRNAVRLYRKCETGEIMIQTNQVNKIIIAVTSSSGGTGKTTTCRNIGAEFARRGKRVLMIDIDPQANLDLFCGLIQAPHHPDGDVSNVFAENFNGNWPISSIEGESLELVRGNRAMIEVQTGLSNRRNREKILSRALKSVPDYYEIIIIDCPATGGALVDNALAAATHVIAPIILEEKSIQGLGALLASLPKLAFDLDIKPPDLLGIIPFTRGKSSTVTSRSCREGLEGFAEHLNFEILPGISESEDVRKAHGQGYAIGKFRPTHRSSEEFRVLTDRIETKLGVNNGKAK